MMRIMHIVGNRPQFIKLAPVSRELRRRGYQDIIIHTGQHFDKNMSDVFFDELEIPRPDENLHISGGSHAQMTADMMKAIEPMLINYTPDVVVVYGDTNSTLAATIVAKKLNIQVVHIEAGVRTGSNCSPEEINRKMIDHVADMLFAADMASMNNLSKEGLREKSVFSGDVMYDTFLYYQKRIQAVEDKYALPKDYVLMTWHRQENTSDRERMLYILNFIEKVQMMVVCPMHPRTRKMLLQFGLWDQTERIENFKIIDPVGYLDMISMMKQAKWILTDSGGLSKESYFAQKRCMFMMELVLWPDLEECRWIEHLGDDMEKSLLVVKEFDDKNADTSKKFYGDGNAAQKIVNHIVMLKG